MKTCETYPFETSQESFLSFIVEAFELCLFAFMHSSYRIPMLKVNLSCFYCDGFRFWIFGGFLSSLKINFLSKIVGYFFFKDKMTDNMFQNVLFLRDGISIIRVIDK